MRVSSNPPSCSLNPSTLSSNLPTFSPNLPIKESTSVITKKLMELKSDYIGNLVQIDNLQHRLDSIIDNTLRCNLEATSNFEILNNERITPHFLNLAKGSKAEASLADLRDDNGDPFPSDLLMKEYVHNYYQNLYRKPACEDNINRDSISNFLGEEICNSRLVQDSKIPENVKLELEEPLSLQELDLSASQGNRSAAGMNGINNCFIKKFWHYLRTPLHRYVTFCHGSGTLSQSFKTASIKLNSQKRRHIKTKKLETDLTFELFIQSRFQGPQQSTKKNQWVYLLTRSKGIYQR
jgi:hypothetical protein